MRGHAGAGAAHAPGPAGVRPCRRTASSLATTIAAAPSDSGEDEPAVTIPPVRKTGRERGQLLQRGGRARALVGW